MGLGNHIPMIVNGFVLAVITGRFVLVDYPMANKTFQFSPNLDYSSYHHLLPKERVTVLKNYEWEKFSICATENLQSYYQQPVWELEGVDYWIPLLQANPHYTATLERLFPDGQIGHHVLTKIVRLQTGLESRLEVYKASKFGKFNVGIHFRQHKRSSTVGSIRMYASVALQLGANSGRKKEDIRFHLATDDPLIRQRFLPYFGDRLIHLSVDWKASNSANNPGGSMDDAVLDWGALASCNELVITYGSSFGNAAASYSGSKHYVIMPVRDNLANSREVAFWGGASSEMCFFMSKGFVGNPNTGDDAEKLWDDFQRDKENGVFANDDVKYSQQRMDLAKALVAALPSFWHHTQCDYS
ncbi:hypothetical protein SmJEL517_g04261 [Synchytrium microbalum]|uniref:Fucosyltransferase n=1 Tax=Synchytrium microbalum TaxID=1806994 RepID=A0A507C412_9FUNG|nr:uncharacterized protein SmJEL517_g04261 [Synchytrium microbalum]TPX32706.1 hypothetical protein SmJEL517_g04261 [Synchytrium microbalum]